MIWIVELTEAGPRVRTASCVGYHTPGGRRAYWEVRRELPAGMDPMEAVGVLMGEPAVPVSVWEDAGGRYTFGSRAAAEAAYKQSLQ